MRGKLTDWLVYLAVRVAICVIQSLSIDTCARLARAAGWFCADVIRIRGRLVEENLRLALPERSDVERRRLARGMWEHLVLLVCEVAHAPRFIHDTNWRDFITFTDKRALVVALLDRRPTILVSGHFGNFEMASYLAGLLGMPTHAIARPLDNIHLHEYVEAFRGASGQFMLPKEGSAARIQQVLERGGALALLADQHGGDKGCWQPFFGRLASYHKALALFSLTNGAPMLVSYARRNGRPLHFEVGCVGVFDPREHPNTTVDELTGWYSQRLEMAVRRDPEQYWWLHRRWRQPPERVARRWSQRFDAAHDEGPTRPGSLERRSAETGGGSK